MVMILDPFISIQEVDCFGETVQDNVEKALNKIKEQLSTLEKRGRSESIKDAEVSLHTLEPASMTRQVCIYMYISTFVP